MPRCLLILQSNSGIYQEGLRSGSHDNQPERDDPQRERAGRDGLSGKRQKRPYRAVGGAVSVLGRPARDDRGGRIPDRPASWHV